MTKRTGAGAPVRAPLTDLENEVMRAVWELQPCTVDAVHRMISRTRTLKEASTRTILRRLEHKGYLSHVEENRAYVYRAVEAPRRLAARAVRQILDRFCRGSLEELVAGMVESKVLSPRELDRLEEFVRNQKKGGS